MTKDETRSPLVRGWLEAARLLSLEVEAPCSVALPLDATVEAEVLVRHVGASRGMVIVRRYDDVRGRTRDLQAAGYGFSVMSDPRLSEGFDLQSYVDVLRDWGWSGDPARTPVWMKER